jgi:hypothetical protein
MRWPVLVGAMLIAAGPAAASSPLVYKAPPPAQPVHLHSPARENDLFPRFLEWLKRQASLTSTVLHYFEEAQTARGQAPQTRRGTPDGVEHRQATGAAARVMAWPVKASSKAERILTSAAKF